VSTYFPWISRVAIILGWLYDLLREQVDPAYEDLLFAPPDLWPGWSWAQLQAIQSHAMRPWRHSWTLNQETHYLDDDDDF